MYGGGGMYGRPYGSPWGGGGMYGGGGPMGERAVQAGGCAPGDRIGRRRRAPTPQSAPAPPHPAPPIGPWDPNDPHGPPAPPSAWQAMLAAVGGVVAFFGRLSFLVDENAHAVHFFISALLQLLDRLGSLYGELARFVLRLLGYRPREQGKGAGQGQGAKQQGPGQGQGQLALAGGAAGGTSALPARRRGLPGLPGGPMAAPAAAGGGWDGVWARKEH